MNYLASYQLINIKQRSLTKTILLLSAAKKIIEKNIAIVSNKWNAFWKSSAVLEDSWILWSRCIVNCKQITVRDNCDWIVTVVHNINDSWCSFKCVNLCTLLLNLPSSLIGSPEVRPYNHQLCVGKEDKRKMPTKLLKTNKKGIDNVH